MYEHFENFPAALQMLTDRAIGETAINHFDLRGSEGGVRYQCMTPSGKYIFKTKSLPDWKERGVPKYIAPTKMKTPDDLILYLPPGVDLPALVKQANGKLLLQESEACIWAAAESGVLAATAIFGEGTMKTHLPQLKELLVDWLGATSILHYHDMDDAGFRGAYLLREALKDTSLVVDTRRFPGKPDSKFDFGKQWVKYARDSLMKKQFWQVMHEVVQPDSPEELATYAPPPASVPAPRTEPLPTPSAPDRQQSGSDKPQVDGRELFRQYAEEVKRAFTSGRKTRKEGRIDRYECANPGHMDETPSARISYDNDKELGVYICQCSPTTGHSWKQVGEWIGVTWEDYEAKHGTAKKHQSANRPEEAPTNPAWATDFDKSPFKDSVGDLKLQPEIIDMMILPGTADTRIITTRNQMLDLSIRRMKGEVRREHLPVIFPIRALHTFTGVAHVIDPGQIIAVMGVSGGGKTMLTDIMCDIFAQTGIPGFVYSGEWKAERQADRAIKRWDQKGLALSPTQIKLHEIALYEMETFGETRDGVLASPQSIAHMEGIAAWMKKWKADVYIIDEFDIDVIRILATIRDQRTQLLAQGINPRYVLFDYLQLLDLPAILVGKMSVEQMVKMIKKQLGAWGMFGIMLTQVTKQSTAAAKGKKGDGIKGGTGMYVRSDQFNLEIALFPFSTPDSPVGFMQVDITKNSEGRPGRLYLKTLWDRMMIMDEPISKERAAMMKRSTGGTAGAPRQDAEQEEDDHDDWRN